MKNDTPSVDVWSETDLIGFVRQGVRVAPAMIAHMTTWPGVDVGFLANSVRHTLNDLVARGELGRYRPSGNSYVYFVPEEGLDQETVTARRERIRTNILRKMTPGAWIAGKRLHLELGVGTKQEIKLAVRSLIEDGALAASEAGQRADLDRVALRRLGSEPAADGDAICEAPVELGLNAALVDDALRFIARVGAVGAGELGRRYADHPILGSDGDPDPFPSIARELSRADLIDEVPARGSWPAVRYRLSARGHAYFAQHPERPEAPVKEPGHVVLDLSSSTRARLIDLLDSARRLKSEAKDPVFVTLDENSRLQVVIGFGERAKGPQHLRSVRALRAAIALYQSAAEQVLAEIVNPGDPWREPQAGLLIAERFVARARHGDWTDRTEFGRRVKFGAVPLVFLSEPGRETMRKRKDALIRQFS